MRKYNNKVLINELALFEVVLPDPKVVSSIPVNGGVTGDLDPKLVLAPMQVPTTSLRLNGIE